MIIRRFSSALVLASVLGMPVLAACDGTVGDVISAKDAGAEPDGSIDPGFKAKANKVDLLFMIDNSASMADKQTVLALAVPDLVQRITNPKCIDPATKVALPRDQQPLSFAQACPSGSVREFLPIDDIHIGVISSSLGGHGGGLCEPGGTAYAPTQNDSAHLITRNAAGGTVETWDGKGFLDWDPTQTKSNPAGEKDSTVFANKFRDLVLGVGQEGCGYEAQLESVYRFLVDPAPYLTIEKVPCSAGDTGKNCIAGQGIDQAVLSQRSAFLRPDSLVSVVMLTDENDCSIVDGGQSHLLTTVKNGSTSFHLPRATSACETNPLSPDCKSCGTIDVSSHPECQSQLTDLEDAPNLRCFHQKQRFGFDWLQPVQRYISGFSKPVLDDGRVNPLFCANPSVDGSKCNGDLRDSSLVVVSGIVGVPWQDLARNPKDLREGYKSSTELAWDDIIGKPEAYVEPNDPFMRESIDSRSGISPFTGESVSAPTALWNANSINGRERNIETNSDLQYACTFELPTPLECDSATGVYCDCENQSNPLCQSASDPTGSAKKQYRGKAYPGIRQLSVVKALGTQGLAASICTPNITDPTRDDFGYRPAVQALGDRLAMSLVAPK